MQFRMRWVRRLIRPASGILSGGSVSDHHVDSGNRRLSIKAGSPFNRHRHVDLGLALRDRPGSALI